MDPAPPLPDGVDLGVDGISPFFTPNADFYRVDTALEVPVVDPETWSLRIHGLVEREVTLSLAELLELPTIERDITLACVSNQVGGPYVGNARWLGVPAGDRPRAGRRPLAGADQLVSRSIDGMTIGTPTAVALDGRDAMLAVGMNGEPLPAANGFPVRMVVPGLYGYVSATKWLVDLELTTFDAYDPYWVQRGWAPEAPIKTMSRIDTPRPLATIPSGRDGHRRRGLGAAPRHRRGRGPHRRRPVAGGPPRRGRHGRHVAPVDARLGGPAGPPSARGPGDRWRRNHPNGGPARTLSGRRDRLALHRHDGRLIHRHTRSVIRDGGSSATGDDPDHDHRSNEPMNHRTLLRTVSGLALAAVIIGACSAGGASTAPTTAPESMAAESMAPESMAPESMAPESMAPSAGRHGRPVRRRLRGGPGHRRRQLRRHGHRSGRHGRLEQPGPVHARDRGHRGRARGHPQQRRGHHRLRPDRRRVRRGPDRDDGRGDGRSDRAC